MKLYVFLVRRPQDRFAWPITFSDNLPDALIRAEAYPSRVSPIVEVELHETVKADNND